MRVILKEPLSAREVARDVELAIREPKDEPLRLKSYATADLPTASEWGFGLVYDNDAATIKFSNGSAWQQFQPLDSDLTAIAGLTSAANKVPYATGAGTWALADFTAAGRALVDDADPAAQRTTLELGSAALKNTGTSGDAVPVLNGATPTFANDLVVNGVVAVGTSFNVGLNQVVGARGAAVADATDAASTTARLNDLLARCRAHGLIAT